MNRREVLIGAAWAASCGPAVSLNPPPPFPMRRGINLGNALEAPTEGEWGYRIQAGDLDAIAEAGFDGVRLPVRWDTHTEAAPPYIIDPAYLDRVDEVTAWALERGLKVQLDVHHYDALIAQPEAERARFISIWRQIAEFYAGANDQLWFELLNEPNGDRWRGPLLTEVQAEGLAAIRESNPTRLVVLGPGDWNAVDALQRWTPPADPHIAVSVHYYEPHDFTHQNAEWLGADAPTWNRTWGETADLQQVARHARRAADWAIGKGLSLQLGEFGVNQRASLAQRVAWTRAVRAAWEDFNIGWCVWDFAGAFAIWNRDQRQWIPEMRDALIS